MQEGVEQERAERVTLLGSLLQMEVRVGTHVAAAVYMKLYRSFKSMCANRSG